MKTRDFNYLPAVRLGRRKQGLIYYLSHNYHNLPPKKRKIIDAYITSIAGEHAKALKRYMTTEDSAAIICMEEFIGSPSTLYSLQRTYYELFPIGRILG